MSKESFAMQIESFEEVHELPNSWSNKALNDVLDAAEFDDDVSDSELLEMTVMALQDLGQRPAAELVLAQVFGDSMGVGVRENLASELDEERPWEQFSDVAKQAGIFNACVLLQRAFPNQYGTPDAVMLTLNVSTESKEFANWLEPLDASLLVRLLASGMSEDAVLMRLYEEEINGREFSAAQHILWYAHPCTQDIPTRLLIYSSHQWLDPLETVISWTSSARPDGFH